jgi:hypothetical protein
MRKYQDLRRAIPFFIARIKPAIFKEWLGDILGGKVSQNIPQPFFKY